MLSERTGTNGLTRKKLIAPEFFLDKVKQEIHESLCLYGTGVIIATEALAEIILGGLRCARRHPIWTFVPALHRNPEN
ncbi:hypothetical protein TB2_032638 [Malus domestica]